MTKKLPKGHVWICEPCGSSVASHLMSHVASYQCEHTQRDKDSALLDRLWPLIEEKVRDLHWELHR